MSETSLYSAFVDMKTEVYFICGELWPFWNTHSLVLFLSLSLLIFKWIHIYSALSSLASRQLRYKREYFHVAYELGLCGSPC